ncbi:hypothetical protein AGMMS50230_20170 [Spirochaetia bacterium]|nr:hypothetical protein AGMMS50230_20170 [Spirochaetia bacterium]
MTEKEKGNLDIVVKAPIPATDRHTALYGLEDIAEERDGWTNTAIAEYYGIKSIKGLYNDDPWPSLWKPESF